MTTEESGSPLPAPRDVAAYIAAMAEELATLAKSQRLYALGRILDMARMEANQIAQGFGEQGFGEADDEVT